MNSEIDYYAVMGILPDAESVVVVAAYRALASLYHPDKWKGNAQEATRRMTEINVAYGVLGESTKRKEYDSLRGMSHGTFESKDDEKDAAFDTALSLLEGRWKIAVNVFPDLEDIRTHLAKTAHRLAFAFVTVMLEKKLFENRQMVAASMENAFLERYFGTDASTIQFAKELIRLGQKDAIVALNQYVDVLGSRVDPLPVIAKIEKDYKVRDVRKAAVEAQEASIIEAATLEKIAKLKSNVRHYRNASEARELASLMGYEVNVLGGGLFKPDNYEIRKLKTKEHISTLTPASAFVRWAVETICL